MQGRSSEEDMAINKILAPLTDNPNAPNEDGETPISCAIKNGNIEIVKILAPLTDNPNAPNDNGYPPIYWAAHYGHAYRNCQNIGHFIRQS